VTFAVTFTPWIHIKNEADIPETLSSLIHRKKTCSGGTKTFFQSLCLAQHKGKTKKKKKKNLNHSLKGHYSHLVADEENARIQTKMKK